MKLKNTFLAVLLLSISSVGFAANKPNLSGFDFNYSVDLNKSIGLTQVFDDGDRTYFQFTHADGFPSIQEIKDGKPLPVSLEVRPPYLIANGVANKYKLTVKNGKTAIYVSYNGNRVVEPKASESAQTNLAKANENKLAMYDEKPKLKIAKKVQPKPLAQSDEYETSTGEESATNSTGNLVTGTLLNIPFFENSVSLSKKAREDLAKRSDEINNSSKIVVRGRPSVRGDVSLAKTRALAIKNYLADIGIEGSTIELAHSSDTKKGKNEGFYVSELILIAGDSKTTAKKEAAKKQYWDLTLNDNNLESALNRWATKAGYQAIVWDLQEEIPINSTVRFEGSFEEAIESVMSSLRHTDLPLKAKYYSNKVVRITHYNGSN